MQAARGASLTPSDQSTPDRSRRPRVWLSFVAIALVALAVDLSTKEWALRALADEDIRVVDGWFTLHLTFNPGAAFSTGPEFTVVFSCLAVIACLVVLWVSRRLASPGWAVALGLLLGGVAGNLVDRVFRDPAPMHGHVVDFLMLPNWPVFNFADVFINVAAGLIILQSFRGIGVDGSRDGESER